MRRNIFQATILSLMCICLQGRSQIDYNQLNMEDIRKFSSMSRSSGDNESALSGTISADMYGGMPLGSDMKNSLRRKAESLTPGAEIDRPIDDTAYIVGPGDILTIYLWGSMNSELYAEVNPEGVLIIPTIGSLPVNGKKLADVKTDVHRLLSDKYKNVSMTISLSRIKVFKAYIVGSVASPGAYVVNGASRIVDLILLAGGLKFEADSVRLRLRGITIENDNHPTRIADLATFYHSNDPAGNPYLLPGDRVHINRMKQFVSVFGAIGFPGLYDYVDGDTFESVLKAAGGLTREADTSNIIITRFVDDIDSLISFRMNLQEARSFPLLRDDRLLICGIPDFRVHRTVEVRGEVEYPGTYPIQKDRTHLKDVIAAAGGLTDDAFLPGSTILRRRSDVQSDREYERLRLTPITALTPLERSYLKSKQTEEEGRISIDFQELYENNQEYYNIILEDNDIISISRKDISVNVTGAVVSPGLVSHKTSMPVDYYIRQAGGFNTRARKYSVMIIKGGTGIWLRPREVKTIEAGDKIWIPEKEYHNWFNVTRDILAMTGAVATIALSYVTIRDRVLDK